MVVICTCPVLFCCFCVCCRFRRIKNVEKWIFKKLWTQIVNKVNLVGEQIVECCRVFVEHFNDTTQCSCVATRQQVFFLTLQRDQRSFRMTKTNVPQRLRAKRKLVFGCKHLGHLRRSGRKTLRLYVMQYEILQSSALLAWKLFALPSKIRSNNGNSVPTRFHSKLPPKETQSRIRNDISRVPMQQLYTTVYDGLLYLQWHFIYSIFIFQILFSFYIFVCLCSDENQPTPQLDLRNGMLSTEICANLGKKYCL